MRNTKLRCCLAFLLLLLLTTFTFHSLYQYDNKYQTIQAPIDHGVLDSDQLALGNDRLYSLVDHWLYYPDIPKKPNQPTKITPLDLYIGQYPDFSLRKDSRSPYGIASYQLTISATKSKQTLALYFPEIDTASQIWLDETLLVEHGDIQAKPIQSQIKNTTISFSTDKEHVLTVMAANDTHYYSGLYYPPILSTPQGIQNMVVKKLLFYGFLVFSSLSIALFTISLWLRQRKDALTFTFAIITLAFAVFASREIFRMFGIRHVSFFYALIDMAYFMMMSGVLHIHSLLCAIPSRDKLRRCMRLCAGMMCLLPWIHLLPLHPSAQALSLYGWIVDGFKYLNAAYLLYCTWQGLRKKKPLLFWLICVDIFTIIGILYTLWTANLFEPICFGWPNEYASFFIVVSLALLMVQRNVIIQRENEELNTHLGELVDHQMNQLTLLLEERKAMLAEFAHDLKAPISSMQSFIELIRHQDTLIDDEVEEYLTKIASKSEQLQSRMRQLQEFSNQDHYQEQKVPLLLQDFLHSFYLHNKADCDACGVYFDVSLCEEECWIYAQREQLTRALENLLYNALTFTTLEGHILLSLQKENQQAHICMIDDGCGIAKTQLASIFHKGVSLREEQDGNQGLGLYITKSIILSHNGTIWAESDGHHGSIFHLLLPLSRLK